MVTRSGWQSTLRIRVRLGATSPCPNTLRLAERCPQSETARELAVARECLTAVRSVVRRRLLCIKFCSFPPMPPCGGLAWLMTLQSKHSIVSSVLKDLPEANCVQKLDAGPVIGLGVECSLRDSARLFRIIWIPA
jgi:hypothetical protein